MVDLNAAEKGGRTNLDVIRAIADASSLFIQNGGGIRSLEALEERFAAGVDRAVLGTAAAEDPDFAAEALKRYGPKIAVGLDCLGDEVRTHGWTKGSGLSRTEVLRRLERQGVRTIIYTDISRDGALTGPSFKNTEKLILSADADVILSGGVSCEEDLAKAKAIGAAGAIIGRAYYEGRIDLARCIRRYEKGEINE